MKNFLMPWTHEFLLTQLFILYLAFFLSTYVKALAFYFLCSDNEDPKRDATTAASADTRAADEPSMQEVGPVAKSSKAPKASKAPVKKPVTTRGSKRLKSRQTPVFPWKSTSPRTPLTMCVLVLVFCFYSLRDLHTHVLVPEQVLMKKFVTLGTECVEYLKASRASDGNLLSYTLLISSAFLYFFI
jgi:hypothetical protein